jgi:hypothetical protein
MTSRRVPVVAALLVGALQLGAGRPARADGPAPLSDSARATLAAERAQVRAELDRANAEIDALKRGKRGVGDDYRLRARLADAEALARRLSQLDARLGAPAGGAPRAPLPGAEPTLAATDGPAEMEAKADILADQARRFSAQAEALGARAHQIKARQDLRRRAGQMEHDPFSPLEGSKRRVAASTTPAFSPSSSPGSTSDGRTSQTAQPPTATIGGGATPTMTGSTGPGGVGSNVAGTGAFGVVSPGAAPSPTGGNSSSETGSLSVLMRDLLDPTTLGEIRRLESSGAPGASAQAMERAAAALRARAERLQAQSQALRAKAKTSP